MLRPLYFILLCILLPGLACGNSVSVQHPVYPPSGKISSYEEKIKPILNISEIEMLNIIPGMNGLLFCGCPNCTGGSQENQMEWNGINDPNHVHCRFCKMIFPNNKYPENKSIKAVNRQGEKEIWQFYEDDKKQEYFFSARARYAAKQYMAECTYNLAAAYALTGKKEYARRAALLLNRYAEVYPKWNIMTDSALPNIYKGPVSNAKLPYPYWGGIWNRWFYEDIPVQLVQAYDLIYNSSELEKLSRELNIDTKKQIEKMFHSAVEFVRTYKESYGNMSPIIYRGLIVTGRIIGEPDYVHDAVERMKTLYKTGFLFDGFWHEGSIGYHKQTVGLMDVCLHAIKGYNDPPNYQWPKNGSHFKNVDLENDIQIIKRSKIVPLLMTFPDGHTVPVHDEWAKSISQTDFVHGPMLLSDYGHARLGSGSERDKITQAHLHFSGGYGHQHADGLELLLFGKGQELLSDIGYTHTAWNFWTIGTPSHNTVAVNGQSQISSGHGGDIQLYSPKNGPVQAVEASQLQAYPKIVDDYRRRLILIQVTEADAYVVDLFRVKGGNQHDYFLHGSSWYPQTADINLPLNSIPETLLGKGAKYELPQSESSRGNVSKNKLLDYAMFSNLREAVTGQPFSITWKFTKDSAASLRSTFMGQPGCRVILADTPQIRPAQEDDSKLNDFKRPSLVVQRTGKDVLDSTFIAVHEPFIGQPFLKNIKLLPLLDRENPEHPNALAITHEHGTDYIISSKQLGGEWLDFSQQQGPKSKARLTIVRRDKGRIAFAYLYDGEGLSIDDLSIKCAPSPIGQIIAVNRDEKKNEYSFLISGKLPPDISIKGYPIIITHADMTTHGYIINQVKAQDKGTLVYLEDDPGFDLYKDKTRFLFYPQHELNGINSYRIDNTVIMVRKDDGTYKTDANCSVKIAVHP